MIYFMKNIKLSEYAKDNSITYRTAWNRFKAGKIKNAFKDNLGNIRIKIEELKSETNIAIIYARVSSNENRKNLDSQAERLKEYAIVRGYQIIEIVKEVGSGVNDNRKKLNRVLKNDKWGTLIIEHKDRLTRFGFNYIEILLT